MSDDEARKWKALAGVYKLRCQALCAAAEDYMGKVSHRGRPGRQHPAMVAERRLASAVEAAQDVEAFVEDMLG